MLEAINGKSFEKNPANTTKKKEDKTPAGTTKKKAMDKLDVNVYVSTEGPAVDKKFLREDEKRLMVRRKETKKILEKWDPSLVSTKAKKSLMDSLEDMNMQLRDLRKKLGK